MTAAARPGKRPRKPVYASFSAIRYAVLTDQLHDEGYAVGRSALRTRLHRNDLRVLITRPQRPRTSVADPAAGVAENRLLGRTEPTPPDRVWVCDIIYLLLVDWRWCYLVTCSGTCSCGMVGGHLAVQMPTKRVLYTLKQALTLLQSVPHHSCRLLHPIHQSGLPRPHRPCGRRAQR